MCPERVIVVSVIRMRPPRSSPVRYEVSISAAVKPLLSNEELLTVMDPRVDCTAARTKLR